MAKLNRESRLRDKRAEKQARKAARKLNTASYAAQTGFPSEQPDFDPAMPDDPEPAPAAAASQNEPAPATAASQTDQQ